MDFLELCLKRESCRAYTGESVPRDALEKIAEAGRLSPSACNSQPWTFHVVTAKQNLALVCNGVQVMGMNKFADKAAAFIVIVGKKSNYSEKVGEAVSGREFSSIDIGIAAANITLAAASLGYGTCILGAFNEKKVKEGAGILEEKGSVKLVICIGVTEKKAPRIKIRKAKDEVIKFVE